MSAPSQDRVEWPPSAATAASPWSAYCDFPLGRLDMHKACPTYLVDRSGYPPCECPCHPARTA